MELPGNTAVIDGRIFPVAEWRVEEEYDNAQVSYGQTGKKIGTVVTDRYLEGEMEICVGSLPASLTKKPMHDIYLFPRSGTKDRVLLTDVILSSVFYGDVGDTTKIEFVASDMAQ